VVFVLSTAQGGQSDAAEVARIGMEAADCLARAIARGVFHAHALDDVWHAYADAYPDAAIEADGR